MERSVILEFRAESFQLLVEPPRLNEFDAAILIAAERCTTHHQLEVLNGQATKGSRWIPWHTEAMKDVVTCDKSRGAGNTL